ncbi:DUF4260 domain-containing protein [Fibrella forsythiae]|uniref:DUF4260 domain-containing protein n=1 Tax=Fibrella forsythiae TaxID=2817061 RepID=A0ABS3JFF3_9BACT|nr:DUF4260 domain-containing protein [Fibrella forsythiae]MBO0948710.1 DUF4260 domain-containing protein [Fibrella forsythiae]
MKSLLKLEEAAQFALSIILFAKLPFVWWLYPALLLLPDVSMIGYAINTAVGAFTYNLFHHKGIAILVGLAGFLLGNSYLLLAGIILFGHSAMDRMMGYGLKYTTGFNVTHLGEIGPEQQKAGMLV